jgi:hypothetical protein
MKLDIAQLEFIDINLRLMVVWLENETGLEFTGTSLYRIGDDGVHGTLPLRGVDLRARNIETGQSVVKLINDNWTYDTKRPDFKCAVLHGKGANLHIHLQSHQNTTKKIN